MKKHRKDLTCLIILDHVMKESIQMTFQSYTSSMFWGSLKSYLIAFQVVPSKCMCSIGKENTTSHFWSYLIQLLNSIQFIFHLFTILLIINCLVKTVIFNATLFPHFGLFEAVEGWIAGSIPNKNISYKEKQKNV